jgi:hypothetical protein
MALSRRSWQCHFADSKGNIVAVAKVAELDPGLFNLAVSATGKKGESVAIKGSLADAQRRAEEKAERLSPGARPDQWRED